MALSRIGDRTESFGVACLDYRVFINSPCDWPVGPHQQRNFLYGLLPPTTSVVAALVQTSVTAAVGGY